MLTEMEGGRKRARTDEQKLLRRQSILDAAKKISERAVLSPFR